MRHHLLVNQTGGQRHQTLQVGERTDHVERCRLSGTVRTKQSQHIALSNPKRYTVNDCIPAINLCGVDDTERVLRVRNCVGFSGHIRWCGVGLGGVIAQRFPRTPSLERVYSPRIPPDQYAKEGEPVDDEVEDRSTKPLQLSQVGCRDGLVSTTQQAEQVDGYKGGPGLTAKLVRLNTSRANE